MCRNLQKELVIGLNMKQLYQLGGGWNDNGYMLLQQVANVLIYSIKSVVNVTNLKTISNVKIPAHSIATLPTKRAGKCSTSRTCIFEVRINK